MPAMFLDSFTRVHCIGIGGIGISAVAKFCWVRGKRVSGSDSHASHITQGCADLGIIVSIGASVQHLAADTDLVVYSEAVPETHPERLAAQARGIRQLGHFDFLGALSKEYRTVCITGTNGKSTTTAMAGKIFEAAGMDPTVFVGAFVPGFPLGNVRVGQGNILLVEGDEYKQKMVKLFPEITVVTNIEKDHLDVYHDIDHIVATFQELVDKTPGSIYINEKDTQSARLVSDRITTYCENDAPVASLQIPGAFNLMNAAGAAMAARSFGIAEGCIASTLADFPGIWRRFERVGLYNGAPIISDYAHHPTAIKVTLEGAREFFPGKHLLVLFEPHQHSRTQELFDDFVGAFDGADTLILSEVYGVEGRTAATDRVSSAALVEALRLRPTAPKTVMFAADLAAAESTLRSLITPASVVLIMGAGPVDDVARALARG